MINSTFNRNLLWIYMGIATLVGLLNFVALQYFDVNLLPSIYFLGQDGWCPENQQALGRHCFGDFGLPMQVSMEPNPWHSGETYIPYPAAGLIIFTPFAFLYELTGSYAIALGLYMFFALAAASTPALYVTSRMRFGPRFLGILVTVSLAPIFIALDRGNSIIFAVPLLLALMTALRNDDWGRTAGTIIALSLLKPQFILLVLVLFFAKKNRRALFTLVVSGALNLAAYGFWWRSFPANVWDSIHALSLYQNYQSLAVPWPANLSLLRPFFWLEYIARFISEGHVSISSLKNFFTVSNASALSLLLIATLVVAIIATNRSRSSIDNATFLLVVACLGTSVSYSYYLIFVVPMLAIKIRDEIDRPNNWPASRKSMTEILWTSAILAGLTRIPLPIPFNIGSEIYVLTSAELTPILFLSAIGFSLAAGFRPQGVAYVVSEFASAGSYDKDQPK